MSNTNPQAIRIANEKIRVCADRLGQLYNLSKAYQAEATAENWSALFPNDAEVIVDGSATDGRGIITNADVSALITLVGAFITFMEASSSANRNLTLKIAVNPEKI